MASKWLKMSTLRRQQVFAKPLSRVGPKFASYRSYATFVQQSTREHRSSATTASSSGIETRRIGGGNHSA